MEAAGGEFSNVLVDWHVGPMLSEDGSAIGLDFTEGDCLKATGSLQTKRESPRYR